MRGADVDGLFLNTCPNAQIFGCFLEVSEVCGGFTGEQFESESFTDIAGRCVKACQATQMVRMGFLAFLASSAHDFSTRALGGEKRPTRCSIAVAF